MKCWESKNVTIGNKGFTLAEILVVIAILSILLSLAIPVYGKFADNAKEQACIQNRKQLLLDYTFDLIENEVDHNNHQWILFFDNMESDICPNGGVINYGDDKVNCSYHNNILEEDEEVPFL